MNIGIHAIGIYLPEEIRRNDWWPTAVVEKWRELVAGRNARRQQPNADELPPGANLILEAIRAEAADPFKGGKERRVRPQGMQTSDMEAAAAKDALARAGISASEVGALFTYNTIPDYLVVPTAPRVHSLLGLPASCLATEVNNACNSFQTQLDIAGKLIASGQIRYALLVQSNALQHFIRPEDNHSAWFGDGATAVVIGPVKDGYGLLGRAHRTCGDWYRALVGHAPGHTYWYQGPLRYEFVDREAAVKMALSIAASAREVVHQALSEAHLELRDVTFYSSHQGTQWLRRVTQAFAELHHAAYVDTYSWTTSLSAANIPLCLGLAEREGKLKDGDVVAMFSGGSGVTYSGSVLRWVH